MTARCNACDGWGCDDCGTTGIDRDETERRRKMGKRSRAKGKRGERSLAKAFTEAGIPARRGLQSRGSAEQPDIVLDGLEDFYVEAKVGRAPPWRAGWEQAFGASGAKTPICITKRDREDAFVHIALDDFLVILKELRDRRQT